jgi:hypothetical protein
MAKLIPQTKHRGEAAEGRPSLTEQPLPGESQDDFEARTVVNGPEPNPRRGHTPVSRVGTVVGA